MTTEKETGPHSGSDLVLQQEDHQLAGLSAGMVVLSLFTNV